MYIVQGKSRVSVYIDVIAWDVRGKPCSQTSGELSGAGSCKLIFKCNVRSTASVLHVCGSWCVHTGCICAVLMLMCGLLQIIATTTVVEGVIVCAIVAIMAQQTTEERYRAGGGSRYVDISPGVFRTAGRSPACSVCHLYLHLTLRIMSVDWL